MSSSSNSSSQFLPMDDGELEMEELEGLVRISSPAIKTPRNKRGGTKRGRVRISEELNKRCHRIMSKPKLRNRLILLVSMFVLFIVWRMTRVDERAEVIEQNMVELGEEETKNFTTTSSLEVEVDSESSNKDEEVHEKQPQEDVELGQQQQQQHDEEPHQTTTTTTPINKDDDTNKSEQESEEDTTSTTTNAEETKAEKEETTTAETKDEGDTSTISDNDETSSEEKEEQSPDGSPDGDEREEKKDEETEAPATINEKEEETITTNDEVKDEGNDEKSTSEEDVNNNEEEKEKQQSSSVTENEEDTPKEELNEEENEQQEQSGTEEEEEENDGGWGHWKFYDGGADDRPETEDYMLKYPNKDVPADDFPVDAWQTDAVYVNHFIEEAMSLVSRAKEAILTEYGHGLPRTPEQSVEAEQMFKIHILNLTAGETEKKNAAGCYSQGGWTTERSFEGLSRRLLHAMMTHDTFTFILGGHSAAAGHGNHFQQSYMMQFHKVMEPIFERLGMKLVSRNLSQGGLGTMHNALGSKSIYGNELDMVLWDSKMTESGSHEVDIFMRQVLLAGNRVPFVMCSGCDSNVMKHLHNEGMADIGMIGDGLNGIPQVEDAVQANDIAWAARYMKCSREAKDLCGKNKYNSTCWIDREDVTPPTPQKEFVGGRASWHPGWRHHQLQGRVLAMWVLDALFDALQTWQDITIIEGDPLADEHWHMTEYYNNIVDSITNKMSDGHCENQAEQKRYPKRICRLGLDGRTEHTPRANPDTSSIRSIIKPPADPEKHMPQLPDILYDGENLPIPALQVPKGEVDVRKIVSARRVLRQRQQRQRRRQQQNNHVRRRQRQLTTGTTNNMIRTSTLRQYLWDTISNIIHTQFDYNSSNHQQEKERHLLEISTKDDGQEVAIVSEPKYGRQPGKGWGIGSTHSGFCDGSYYSITCGREPKNDCLLSGHNDQRGTLMGDGMAGWLLLDLGIVKHGIIILHIDYWHGFGGTELSKKWHEPNDGEYERRQLEEDQKNKQQQQWQLQQYDNERNDLNDDEEENQQGRRILKATPVIHDDFIFEAAINDKIVIKYNKDEYMENQRGYQRVLQAQIILDDENWEEQEVELGIRVSGCKRDQGNTKCSVGIGHVYWA